MRSKKNMALLACMIALCLAVPRLTRADDETLDLGKDKDFNLNNSSDDDAKFEKQLEQKLDEDNKPTPKPEAVKKADSTSTDDFSDFDEKPAEQKPPPPPPEKNVVEPAAPSEAPAAAPAPEAPPPEDNIEPVKNEPPPVNEPEPLTSKQLEAGAPQTPSVSDDPDISYEAKLHDIYVNYYSKKTPDTEWQTLVGSHATEQYKINRGDNLWNISKTLFGDGNYWPKVWSLNSKVTNPHLVTTNNQIRFMLGDESAPPAFTVTENATENTNVKVDVSNQTKTDVNVNENVVQNIRTEPGNGDVSSDEPEIPPPLKVSKPVLRRLPPSLPEWQDASAHDHYDSLGVDVVKRKILDLKDQIPLVSYITEEPPVGLGRPTEIEVGNKMASSFQYVYVLMNKGVGQVGETFLAVSSRGENESSTESVQGFLGYSIDVQGEVQLVEKVDAKPGVIGDMFRAIVLRIINPVTTDSILIRDSIENILITDQGPRSQIVAQIIGGSYFNKRQVYGSQSVAYLNRGTNDGLAIGQVLPIRANRIVRTPDTDVNENVRPIGWLRIVRITPHFATAVVVRSWSDVLSGDLTGSGQLLAPGVHKAEVDGDRPTGQPQTLMNELDQDEDMGATPDDFPADTANQQKNTAPEPTKHTDAKPDTKTDSNSGDFNEDDLKDE